MADNAQNRHESLMKTICGRLMAAPFVFLPDDWKPRPTKRREPADVVWACNNSTILMYLRENQACDEQETSRGRFKKGADHNLGQASGSIRLWKNHAITGKNAWHRFWLPWKQGNRVVVLSVVKTGAETLATPAGNGFVEIHADWAKRYGIALSRQYPSSLLIGSQALADQFLTCSSF